MVLVDMVHKRVNRVTFGAILDRTPYNLGVYRFIGFRQNLLVSPLGFLFHCCSFQATL